MMFIDFRKREREREREGGIDERDINESLPIYAPTRI